MISLEKCTTLAFDMVWEFEMERSLHLVTLSAGEINSHHPRNGDGLGLVLKTVQNVLSQGMQGSYF